MAKLNPYFNDKDCKISEKDISDYVIQRFEDVKSSNKYKNMLAFHSTNKFMLMAHDQVELKKLGNIVASHKKIPFSEILQEYENHLRLAMGKNPTIKTHSNVIMHIFGYFLKHLDQNEKRVFLNGLEQFRENKKTIGEILLEISPITYRFDNTYLASQTYFLLYSDIEHKTIFQPVNIKEHE
ncbi:YbgA family protein [Nitrosarchaeum sp.]|uniref:YbgA family protein n=1 Tax=Nitrosarchaeum sp. TaxID=2026886 RepID=UPI00247DFC0F|nr:YbgA family protein [Nitrosarchaeum sp.]MCV0412104.1 YbgA family protein [Nitrosarchaeum sp.]